MSATWFLELVTSLTAQAAFVILGTFLLTRFTPDSRIACRIWSACDVALLGLVLFAVFLPHPRWLPRFDNGLSRPAVAELLSLQLTVGRMLFAVWLAGAVSLWMWMLVQSIRIARFLQTCRPVPAEHPALADCRDVLHGPLGVHPVRILSSAAISSPFCWQFHRPQIVLPEFLLGLSSQELRFIVRHELTHLRTGHPLQLFLQRVVEVLLWFHPFVWWAARQASRAREFACDDAAIDRPAQVADYLRTLLIVVEQSVLDAECRLPVLAFGREPGLVGARARRLARIARVGWAPKCSRRRLLGAGLVWTVVVVVCLGLWLPVSLSASQRSRWSPWPHWSACLLREFGILARDFEVYDDRIALHELLEHPDSAESACLARPAVSTSFR